MTFDPKEQWLAADALQNVQRKKLAAMLGEILKGNEFYKRKLAGVSFDPARDGMDNLPFTTRAELEADQIAMSPFGTNLTYPIVTYCRFHQTSGSSGRPMHWLDSRESWDWFKNCWRIIYEAAGVNAEDRIGFAFSFGPFIGFWAAFEGAAAQGNLCLPAGGMSTVARLRMFIDNGVSAVCCTPTYALRMAEVAAQERIDLRSSSVEKLIVAGEPGGSVPEVRQKIEAAWGARVFDHSGMTEIGPLGFECKENPGGLHLIESECIGEVVDAQSGRAVNEGEIGELIITNLGRWGSPVIRYRTGDLVRLKRCLCDCGRSFARLQGGILGRSDDMFIVRGNNVFPSAVEAVIRRFADVAEFRVEAYDEGALTQVRIDVEPVAAGNGMDLAERVGRAVQEALSFRAQVREVPPGTLERFEMKARRFIRTPKATK